MSAPELFSKKLLIYIPAYNNRDKILGVLKGIPLGIAGSADILVIDNRSADSTSDVVGEARRVGDIPPGMRLVRPHENLGYAGSQKLAYTLALASPRVERVVMLHGDGQYDPALLPRLLDAAHAHCGLVYGYRTKGAFGPREETPPTAYLVIKLLSLLESLYTGYFRKEWHSGFVMYRTSFLRRIRLSRLTATRHIDGQLLYLSGALKQAVQAVPIYKLYKGYEGFAGMERSQYILDVFRVMSAMRKDATRLLTTGAQDPPPPFDLL